MRTKGEVQGKLKSEEKVRTAREGEPLTHEEYFAAGYQSGYISALNWVLEWE